MRDSGSDRGGYDRVIAAAIAVFVGLTATASAQSSPAMPSELAIDAAVPMPEPADNPPPSPADFSAMARDLAATAKPAVAQPAAAQPAAPQASTITTASAPSAAAPADSAKTNEIAATPPAPAPAVTAPASAPAAPEVAKDAPAKDAPAATNVATADQPVAEKIKDLLSARASRFFDRKSERSAAETFYKERNYAPLWSTAGNATDRAKAAIARLKASDADGLTPSDYQTPDFAAATTPEALAEAELKLSAVVLDYARHAQTGRIHYSRVSADIAYPAHDPEPADVLASVASAKDVAATLDSYNPQHKGYKALKAKLAELRGASETPPAPIAEGPVLKFVKAKKNAKKPIPEMEDDRVPALRARLGVTQDPDSLKYDETVAAAVRKFQSEANLKATGLLDGRTVQAINSPKRGRTIDLVVANMERWRWLPRELGAQKLGDAYVMLNIPEFTLKVMHNGAQAWTTRVVVGKPGRHATPELTETMKFITVNPTWNVPPSIVYGEYLPALQQDPNVLTRMGLKLEQRRDGSVHISQPPGADNALGRIRFNFPNKFLVYQHDTPNKNLFAHETRAYSHGCMRVQNPDMYAETLLGIAMPKENYSAARIRGMYGKSEINLNFPTPIPVHIVYHTAFVDDSGHLHTRKDIYSRDNRLIDVLRSSDRNSMEVAVNHAKPNYSRPATTLPPGVAGADGNRTAGNGGGRNFFEMLFGGPAQPPPPQQRQRRPAERQASR